MRANPQVWGIERTVEPHPSYYFPENVQSLGWNGVGERDRLIVGMSSGSPIEISPDFYGKGREAAARLRKYLSDGELEFLKQEYAFSLRDLETQLHAVAEQTATQRGAQGFSHYWKALS